MFSVIFSLISATLSLSVKWSVIEALSRINLQEKLVRTETKALFQNQGRMWRAAVSILRAQGHSLLLD